MAGTMFRFACAAHAPEDRNDMQTRHMRHVDGRMRRRLATVAAIGASFMAVLSATPASAQSVPELPAGGPLAVVGCTDDQIDFNRASRSAISALFSDVYGDPMPDVAKRVVEGRKPWYLDIEDLKTVNGIGPGRLPALKSSSRVCLGFDTTKPPPVDVAGVCRPGDGRIDINKPSSQPTLAKRFNEKTAQAIVDGIPHAGPQLVIAEHIPGAGKGNPDLQRLCATPPTVTYGAAQAVTWTFAVKETGVAAKSADGRSTLSVPAHALGADRWVRSEDLVATGNIKDTVLWSGDLAALDPKEWASPTWNHELLTLDGVEVQPAQSVHVRLAGDEMLKDEADLDAVIVHFGQAGDFVVTTHAGIAGSGGEAGAWLTHLSDTWLSYQRVTPTAPVRLRMVDGDRQLNAQVASKELFGTDQPAIVYDNDDTCSPEHRDDDLGLIRILDVNGGPLLRWRWCTFFDGNYATWRIRNKRALPVKVTMTGNSQLRGVNDNGNVLHQVLVERSGEGSMAAWGSWHGGQMLLSGDSVGDAQLRRHSDAETITLSTDLGMSTKYVFSNAILEALGLSNNASHLGVKHALSCAYADNVVTCILGDAFEDAVEDLIEAGIVHFGSPKDVAKRFMLAYTSWKILHPLLSDSGSSNMKVAWLLPPKPDFYKGRRVPNVCAPSASYSYTNWRWEFDEQCMDDYYRPADGQPSDGTISSYTGARILRKNSGAAFILDTAGVAHPLVDGGAYICASKYIPVQYGVDEGEFAAAAPGGVGSNAICPPASGTTRNLAPGNPQNNVILRSGDGSRVYIVQDGYLVGLLNGASDFACFSERMLVWDWVSDEEIGRFQRHPSIVAKSCSFGGSLQG